MMIIPSLSLCAILYRNDTCPFSSPSKIHAVGTCVVRTRCVRGHLVLSVRGVHALPRTEQESTDQILWRL